LEGLGVYREVIEVYNYEFADVFGHNLVHKPLEGRGGVAETKRHHIELIESKFSDERGLLFVFFSHGHLPISGGKIKTREPLGSLKRFEDVVDNGKGVNILFGYFIEFPIVYAESSLSSFLGNNYDWRGPWTRRFSDYSFFLHGLDFLLHEFLLAGGNSIGPLFDRSRFFQFYFVFHRVGLS
jgi:hypothetical protein